MWQPEHRYKSVTNRQLTELAGVVHARAIDFVFKPHGDADDIESIILTREQYRQLLPQGERHAALESVKMLLASRPVLYLGFGLRDPDFIYLRDLLANTYKGGTRDHYAFMADVSDDEINYWSHHYGIHLYSYNTIERSDGSRSHNELLNMLDRLLETSTTRTSKPTIDSKSPEVILALARHAAALARKQKLKYEFSIRVHAERTHTSNIWHTPVEFDHSPIESFLDSGPQKAIVIGLPGSGKTYSLRRAAARLSDQLNQMCLEETVNYSELVIPIFADLKLYQGDLLQLVDQTLPSSLPLIKLVKTFKVKIFLDSFNETPREYLENGAYETDFQTFIENLGQASLIISSRTSNGLLKLDLPIYNLDQIDEKAVNEELQRLGIIIKGRFNDEVTQLLQKPFYFQYVASGEIVLPHNAHPRDFYTYFLKNVNEKFASRFEISVDLSPILSVVAYEALNRGEEAFPLDNLLRALDAYIDETDTVDIKALDIANWLVSITVLIPNIGGRIAFVHQSVTEYLAALELAQKYQVAPEILSDKLTLTRWDQALFLTLSLLPDVQAGAFFEDVVNIDLPLAMDAVKYLEIGRDDTVSRLLDKIPLYIEERGMFEDRIDWILESRLPISDCHEPQLRALMQLGNIIGGAAAQRLVTLKGAEIKDELLHELLKRRDDYNYCCNGIAPALAPYATIQDVEKILLLAESISGDITSNSDDDEAIGFISGAASFLSEIDLSVIKSQFLADHEVNTVAEVRARILCNIIDDHHSTLALELAAKLLTLGVKQAATCIYFISKFSEPQHVIEWTSITQHHIEILLTIIDSPDDSSWELRALQCICTARPDLAGLVKTHALEQSGIAKAILLYTASPAEVSQVFEALSELVGMDSEQRSNEPTALLENISINWSGQETLLVQILRLRDSKLALSLLEQIHYPGDINIKNLEIGPISWWLDWLTNEPDPEARYWLQMRIAWLFSTSISKEACLALTEEFNKPDSQYRDILASSILLHQKNLTTDNFSENAISFILEDLDSRKIEDSFEGHLLGQTATEKFVKERLLPLVLEAKGTLAHNLQKVLRQAGHRHGRRYTTN